MINLQFFAENVDAVTKALAKKGYTEALQPLLDLDTKRRQLITEIDELRSKQNDLAKQIPQAEDKTELLSESQAIKEQLKTLEPQLQDIEGQLHERLLQIPNPPLESVPEGKSDEENAVIKTVGEKPNFDFKPLDHVALGKHHDMIDIEMATNMSGARFAYLKGDAARLQFALTQYVTQKLHAKGFTPVVPPVLVREQAMEATGFFPAERSQIYSVNPGEDDLFLVGTSEVPLCMLHANKIIPEEKLPLRYFGVSNCFRREAGNYGKDMHGIIRVHQFEKVEMFIFSNPETSEQEHELLLAIEEEIMQELGLHYQVLNICGGDLGAPAAKKYDIEAWIPSQNKFRELTSTSNCTDFQSRRAKIRFKTEKGKQLVHTLNGTATAIGRTLVAIIENYQQKDHSILIPEALRPFMGGQTQIG